MRRTTLPILAALAGLVVTGLGHDALAAPPAKPRKAADDTAAAPREQTREERIEQARQLFLAAEEKLKAGDFAGALAGFRAVNDVARSPQAIFRIALCIEKVGSRAETEDAFHRFLGLPPPESLAEEKRVAEEHLANLAAGTLRITSHPASATVAVDGKPAVATPVEIRLPAGVHVVLASAPDHEPATREIEVPRGGVMDLAIALAPVPPSAAASPGAAPAPATGVGPAPSAPISPVLAAAASFGLTAIGLGVGIGYGVRAIQAQSDYNRVPSQDLADKQKTSAIISDSAIGASVVFAVVGTVLITQRQADPAPAPAAAWRIVPVISPRAQGAAAIFHF